MFASVKNLAVAALCFGSYAQAFAVPPISPEIMAAFNLTDADLLESRDITAGSALLPRQASCAPPTSPSDSTYGACILPLNDLAREGNTIYMLVLAEYLSKKMGCPTDGIHGGAARPVTQIKAHRCTHPGPERVQEGAEGWSINSVFNPKACPPGSKCL
ncbi:hypothetical protein EsH8_V_000060 [Colletotrichum jinshuiense]